MRVVETTEAVDSRREQILDAALKVIVERGYPETRISDVAEQAGTSPALVIYYFKTRDQLLTEAIRLSEDRWYAAGQRRIAEIPTSAGRLEALVAMSCLPEEEGADATSWVIWLDLWAQAARSPQVGRVRQDFDQHWRTTIAELVAEGQQRGEFAAVDGEDFAITMSALIDGFAVQSALGDPAVGSDRAFRLCMRFAASQLGFKWPEAGRRGGGPVRRRAGTRQSS